MIILGLVVLLLGWLTGLSILDTIGVILVVIGLVLVVIVAATHTGVGGRRWWY